jgi:hypothetical protein
MPSRFIPPSLAFLAVLLACKVVLAASCLVVPEDQVKGAVILNQGKEQALTAHTKLSDCSQLTLARGVIHVLYETQNGEIKRQTCKAPNTPCSVGAGSVPSLFESVTHKAVGKQMDKEVSRLPGLPHGRVFNVERAATFNLAKAGLTHWNLTLTEADSKRTVYSHSGNGPVVQIPKDRLRPGGKYIVLIDVGNQRYTGGFDILGGTEAASVAREITQVQTDTNATARAKKLDELILFYENNLDYEVELLREELKM